MKCLILLILGIILYGEVTSAEPWAIPDVWGPMPTVLSPMCRVVTVDNGILFNSTYVVHAISQERNGRVRLRLTNGGEIEISTARILGVESTKCR